MKKAIFTLTLLNLTILFYAQNAVDITYIANDGFLISGKSGNILVDALGNSSFNEYDVPSEQLITAITMGNPPFGKIDLYLVTHKDGDHFYAPYAINFLKSHLESKFVSSKQVNKKLLGDNTIHNQICTISLELGGKKDTIIGTIPLKIYRFKHSGDSAGNNAISLAYLIKLGNIKILHIGDAPIPFNKTYYDSFHLENENIDVLFLGYSALSDVNKRYLQQIVKPKYIIAMHIPPKEIAERSKEFLGTYQNGFVFMAPMETKTFTK
jgi:L-ascorbate metabolism protein UlaG (beta-lactamase superfamily)